MITVTEYSSDGMSGLQRAETRDVDSFQPLTDVNTGRSTVSESMCAREVLVDSIAQISNASTMVLTSPAMQNIDSQIEQKFALILQLAREIQTQLEFSEQDFADFRQLEEEFSERTSSALSPGACESARASGQVRVSVRRCVGLVTGPDEEGIGVYRRPSDVYDLRRPDLLERQERTLATKSFYCLVRTIDKNGAEIEDSKT
eukprot:44298_1